MHKNEAYSREVALASLASVDSAFPPPTVADILRRPENDHLLQYVTSDAFTHVFGGEQSNYPESRFLGDLDAELRAADAFHLWAEVPLCRYRCHFCQFPVLVLGHDASDAETTARRWVDANIDEARLWLNRVPSLAETPVGEFCLFGGTPTAIPMRELRRLLRFYRSAFNFTSDTSLRAEGSPDTLTEPVVDGLAELGCNALTFGVQSFDNRSLALANRGHTAQQAEDAIRLARAAGIRRVDGDLIWGLPGQGVEEFMADVQRMVELGFDTVVAIKLHLRSFHDVQTAIGHERPAVWEHRSVQERLAAEGHSWPPLGEQFQMRDAAVDMLQRSGHYEHPTTYFPRTDAGPERWRALNLDQGQQVPQVGIGLGTYAWSQRSEASVVSSPQAYLRGIDEGRIPFERVTGIPAAQRPIRAAQMALSTCQPLSEAVHRKRFPEGSLIDGPLGERFTSLRERGLVTEGDTGIVALTPEGATLVEAIMNTEIV